jgi:hypothetical protein
VNNLPAHNHTITISDLGHNHPVGDTGHSHIVNDLGHYHTLVQEEGFQGRSSDTSAWQGGGTLIVQSQTGQNITETTNFLSKTTDITVVSDTTGISLSSNTTDITATSQNTGSGTPYMPPYYVLAYIIRIS